MEPNLNWMISVDDHVIEPPGVWETRLPAHLRDRGPRWLHDEEGEAWHYDGQRLPVSALNAVAGVPRSEWTPAPLSMDSIRPSCFDPKARVADMDSDGVLAQMLFPTMPRFCGQAFTEADDKELALLCVRAYNDWMIEEWCASAPGRFIPLVIMPLWDPHLAAAEIERTAAMGAKAFCFSENPHKLGLPSIHDPSNHWGAMLSTAADADMALCIHIGSSSSLPATSPDAPVLVTGTLLSFVAQATMVDWLFSGHFLRYPNLRLVLSEGGISWIPGTIEAARRRVERLGGAVRNDSDGFSNVLAAASGSTSTVPGIGIQDSIDSLQMDPANLFRDHIFGCMLADDYGWGAMEELGSKNVMVETDFPHSDTSWPTSLETVKKSIAHLPVDQQWDVLQGNARRVFKFTPAEMAPAG